ncbi:molybdopterin-dependent oxidoreductase [Cellulosimicrobium terreum]|nr:molybdopterin-dependent oxidoreductase [Cellulosimicrobium terreum]
MPSVPRAEDFRSPVHDPRVVARVGALLGGAIVVLFLTGLWSHLQQTPVSWLPLGPAPAWGYRVTQGIHVTVGFACVPLLLAKLYTAYPRLFERPALRGPLHALERGSVAVLVAATTFQIVTGVLNVFQVYPWKFSFLWVHYATAWVVIGSVVVHVGVKLPTIVTALRTSVSEMSAERSDDGPSLVEAPSPSAEPALARRGFLAAVAAATLGVVALTVGQTVRPLAPLAVLAPRDPRVGPQGLPVNKTARSAGVTDAAQDPDWRLTLSGPGGTRELSRADLLAMDLVTAVVPIACVEGWSATATWEGVRVRDLAALVGPTISGADRSGEADVQVDSLQQGGSYASSLLPAAFVVADDTLLALRLGGEDLDLDHGYPARIVAPNRPGVLQTKWVTRLNVLGGDA